MTILTGTLADFTAIGPLPAVGGYLRLRLDSFDAEHTTREWITPIVSGQFATELPDLPVNGSVYLRAEGVPGFPNVHVANYDGLATVTLLDLLTATNSDGTARYVVDPLTLAPIQSPSASVAQVLARVEEAAEDANAALTAANGAVGTANAASAALPRNPLVVGDDLTFKLADGSTVNAGNVRGLPGSTVPYGVDLLTADLNTITDPGMYRQSSSANGTLARNYPYANHGGILEVIRMESGNTLMQRFTVMQGQVFTRGIYVRRRSAGAWDTWKFIPSQRVDQTAGRAIYTWDDLNGREQLIYGDTGIRDISALIPVTGIITALAAARLSRYGQTVELTLVGLTKTAGSVSVSGFFGSGFLPASTVAAVGNDSGGNIPALAAATNGDLIIRSSGPVNSGGVVLQFRTNSVWPTVLPGSAFGTIPNL